MEKCYRGSFVDSANQLPSAASEGDSAAVEGGEGDAESVDGYQTDVLMYDTNTGVIEKAPPLASSELMPAQAKHAFFIIILSFSYIYCLFDPPRWR